MEDKNKLQSVKFGVNLDTTPIFYTDNINMTINQDGLVLDILQRVGNTNEFRVVSRIGMSREHAKKFAKKLEELLTLTEGKIETGKKTLN